MPTKSEGLSFDGPLGIEQAAETLKALKTAIAKAKPIIVDLSRVQSLDLSVLQIIVAAKKTAQKKSIPFEIGSRMSPEVVRAFWLSGLVSRVDKGDVNKTIEEQLQSNI